MPQKPPRLRTPSSLPQERLRRLEEALGEGQARQAQALEDWVRQTGQLPSRKQRRRWKKRQRKQARREERRAEYEARLALRKTQEGGPRSPLLGWMYAAGALVTLLVVLRYPRALWWLVFIAIFVFARKALHHLFPPKVEHPVGREEAPLPEPLPARQEADPRVAQVDALCDKLLAELRAGPELLREVVHAPEQTVQALRRSCHELARRERELRALSTPEDERRLAEERAALAARVEAETDAVARRRLAAALVALDEQRHQRAELAATASRLEAEHTRLYYTLENLHTQVLRVLTADATSENVLGAGLRGSLEQLGAEMDAVAEALEEVHRAPRTRAPTR